MTAIMSMYVLDYLAQGHHLLALAGKRPNNRYHAKPSDEEAGWSWEKSIHGMPETPEEMAALDAIFDDPTTTGVAILIPEGKLVADLDTDAAADLFIELGGMVETRRVKTPNGWHLWFDVPGANKSVWLGGRTLLFKGFGGYVAAPPSRHFDKDGVEDGVYTWVGDQHDPMALLPTRIGDMIRVVHALDAMKPEREPAGPTLALDLDADGHWLWTGHAAFNIRGLADAVRSAPEGNRNNMLAWAALTAAEEGVGLDYAMQELTDAARDAGLTARETFITIKAAFSRRRRG
jgi:hypothetical protein